MANYSIPSEYQDAIARARLKAPVRVVSLSLDLGVKVYTEPLVGVSGRLYRDKASKSGWSISVNDGEVKTRQRFTIAHELGHFILHRGAVRDSVQDDTFYRSALTNRMEAQANAFAADLLMPWTLINQLTEEGYDSPSALAAKLNVSEVAMSIRLGIPT